MPDVLLILSAILAGAAAGAVPAWLCAIPRRCPLVIDGGGA